MGLFDKLFKKNKRNIKQETERKIHGQIQVTHEDIAIKAKKENKPPIIVNGKVNHDNLILRQKIFNDNCMDRNYYFSDEAKQEGKLLNEMINNYFKENPKDFLYRGANYMGLILSYVVDQSKEQQQIYIYAGQGLYEQENGNIEEALKYYQKSSDLSRIVHAKDYKEYGGYPKTDDKIHVCKNILRSNKIKEIESKAKSLEKENPKEAIKLYQESIQLNKTRGVPYRRICMIYRKNKDYDSELKVCEEAISTCKNVKWFENRKIKILELSC